MKPHRMRNSGTCERRLVFYTNKRETGETLILAVKPNRAQRRALKRQGGRD